MSQYCDYRFPTRRVSQWEDLPPFRVTLSTSLSQMRETCCHVHFGMLGFRMFSTLGLVGGAHESLHADLTLNIHGLLIGIKLAAFAGALELFRIPFPGHLGLLSIASTHDYYFLHLDLSGCPLSFLLSPSLELEEDSLLSPPTVQRFSTICQTCYRFTRGNLKRGAHTMSILWIIQQAAEKQKDEYLQNVSQYQTHASSSQSAHALMNKFHFGPATTSTCDKHAL